MEFYGAFLIVALGILSRNEVISRSEIDVDFIPIVCVRKKRISLVAKKWWELGDRAETLKNSLRRGAVDSRNVKKAS